MPPCEISINLKLMSRESGEVVFPHIESGQTMTRERPRFEDRGKVNVEIDTASSLACQICLGVRNDQLNVS